MPVYEYTHTAAACRRGARFELRQRITDDTIAACPECGGPVRKLISATSFALKGAGWFADGYASTPRSTSTETGGCGSDACATGCAGAQAAA